MSKFYYKDKETTITAHCLVRNEENWIWYAINSILDYVDKVLVFDTGSTDNTVKIIKTIKSKKIIFEQKGRVDKKGFTRLRQEMLDRTKTDWLLVLDGDEIWPESTIREAVRSINRAPKTKNAVVLGSWFCQGDVYHYNKYLASHSNYKKSGQGAGYMWPRLLRMLPGIHAIGEYGYESYADRNGINVSYWEGRNVTFLNKKYFHMSLLPRSSTYAMDRQVMMRAGKTAYTKGAPFSKNMRFPGVFYKKRPEFVPSPWRRMSKLDELKGLYFRGLNFRDKLLKGYYFK